MGETPPTFDMPPNRAINNTGEKPQKCERQETKRIVFRWYWPDGLDGSEDDMVYKSTEDNWNNSELDFDQIFQSDSESDFEVFLP